MSLDLTLEQASLAQLQQTPIDDVLHLIDNGLIHLPTYRELFYRWERQQWKASEIDFTADRQQWLGISQYERTMHLYNLASFFQGESRVADVLSSYISAMPDEEMRLFVMTQQADEARHTIFFARFFHEVIGTGPEKLEDMLHETRQYMNTHQKVLLFRSLDEIEQRLRKDLTNLDTLVEGVTLYHIVIEGTLALASQRLLLQNYRNRNIFPGFRGGFTAIARDESRHVLFGVKFVREMVQHNAVYAAVVRDAIERYSPIVWQAITPPEAQFPLIRAQGLDPWAASHFAQDSLRKKLKVIGLDMNLPTLP